MTLTLALVITKAAVDAGPGEMTGLKPVSGSAVIVSDEPFIVKLFTSTCSVYVAPSLITTQEYPVRVDGIRANAPPIVVESHPEEQTVRVV
jgi:hypothetical protein